jgi:sugar phosphate isomerase/epimerase
MIPSLTHPWPLDNLPSKLSAIGIHTVELGTGNNPGDAHCTLSILEKPDEPLEADEASVSALSCHGNPLHPNNGV